MNREKMTKRELIKEINALSAEVGECRGRVQFLFNRIHTVEMLNGKSHRHFNSATAMADNCKELLDEERRDSQILLKIQDQLITMLQGKVWLCPSCGQVSPGTDGPQLVICHNCVKL